MTTTVLSPDRRASLLAAARGEHQPTAPVPCGIRVVNQPTRTTTPATTAPVTTAPAPVVDARDAAPAPVVEASDTAPAAVVDAVESLPLGDVEELLARAEASPRQRTRTLGARLRQMLTELQVVLDVEAAESEAQARVAELRRQLAEAEEQLRKARRSDAAPVTPADDSASGPDARAVRAWAAANGVKCGANGRLKRNVVEAWRAATGGQS